MAEFDTTKQESQYYGIRPTQGVVTPEAAYADPNSLGGIAELAEVALDVGDKYNTVRVGEQAEEAAMDLADQYYQGSTGQFEQGVDAGNQRLVTSYNAGAVNPYEFKTRMQAEAQRQIAMNPSKADIITAKMKDVFERTGVADRLAVDEELYKAEMERINKERDARDKILTEKAKLDISNMDEEERNIRFFEYQETERLILEYDQSEKLEKGERKQAARDSAAEMRRNGTFRKEKEVIITNLTRKLEAINRDPNRSDQSKLDAYIREMQNARSKFLSFYGELSAIEAEDKEVANLFANVKLEFDALEKQFADEFSQESITKAINNTASRAKAEIDIASYKDPIVQNEKVYDSLLKMQQTIQLLREDIKNRAPEDAEKILKQIDQLQEKSVGILIGDLSNKDKNDIFGTEAGKKYTNYLETNIEQIKEEAKEQGMPVYEYNALKAKEDWIASQKSSKRFNELDEKYRRFANSPATNLLYDGAPADYIEADAKNLEFYKNATTYYMLNTYKDSIPSMVGKNKDGLLYAVGDSTDLSRTFANDLERINNYVKTVARMNNVDPIDVAEKIYREEFPFLSLTGQEMPEIVMPTNLEEWKALKPGTQYMLPNGRIGTKKATEEGAKLGKPR